VLLLLLLHAVGQLAGLKAEALNTTCQCVCLRGGPALSLLLRLLLLIDGWCVDVFVVELAHLVAHPLQAVLLDEQVCVVQVGEVGASQELNAPERAGGGGGGGGGTCRQVVEGVAVVALG
jgi:hypothetical protein